MSSDVGDVLFCHVVHAIPDTPPLRPYIHPIGIPHSYPVTARNNTLKTQKPLRASSKISYFKFSAQKI